MRVELTKKRDGSRVLRCIRADGSVTWQKQTDRYAVHFAFHDLTHLAVESVMGYKDGFFGLVAQGWEIDDTTGKGPRGALPAQAVEAEHLVGALDTERGALTTWTMEEFAEYCRTPVTEEQLRRIRALRAKLFKAWTAKEPGETLEVSYPASENA